VVDAFENFCRNDLGLCDRDTIGMLNSNDGCTARNPARLLKIGRLRRDQLFGNFWKRTILNFSVVRDREPKYDAEADKFN
jgi:hypothetical protein